MADSRKRRDRVYNASLDYEGDPDDAGAPTPAPGEGALDSLSGLFARFEQRLGHEAHCDMLPGRVCVCDRPELLGALFRALRAAASPRAEYVEYLERRIEALEEQQPRLLMGSSEKEERFAEAVECAHRLVDYCEQFIPLESRPAMHRLVGRLVSLHA